MGFRKIAAVAAAVILTAVACLASTPAKAGFIYDLSVSDTWTGSGSIAFDTLSGSAPSGVSAFSFHTSTGSGGVPQDYDLADIATVSWSIDGLFNLSLLLSTAPVPFGSDQSKILLTNESGFHSIGCGSFDINAAGSHTCAFNTGSVTFDLQGVLSTRLVSITSVPEPSTLALFGAGLLGLGLMSWRRKTKRQASHLQSR